jgi:hypothetical protein
LWLVLLLQLAQVIGPEFEKVFRQWVEPLLKFMAPHRPVSRCAIPCPCFDVC